MSARTRTCLGCAGSGCVADRLPDSHIIVGLAACPVCLGSGTVTEPDNKERIRQALEDAETLRKVARSVYRGFAYKNSDIGAAEMSDAAWMAKGCPGPYIGGYWSENAARHAFLAVPALKDAQ